MKKQAKPQKKRGKRPWKRKWQSDPWNDENVQLVLHFCESLQRRFGLPAVVYEDPKAREENST